MPYMSLVIIGHVDHGKSTLIGRLLLDTGSLPLSVRSKYGDGSGENLAHIADHFKEERDQGITIDSTQFFFHTPERRYVIIDAPGHRELLRNMITGAAHAHAAVLLIDAREGLRDQTRRHVHLLSLMGIKQVVVLINKMDLISWNSGRFEALKGEILGFMKKKEITPAAVLPISALNGENVAVRSARKGWSDYPCLLEQLQYFTPQLPETMDVRLAIQDCYDFVGDIPVYVGRVESGILKAGERYVLNPAGETVRVIAIKHFGQEDASEAGWGESVAVTLEIPPGCRAGRGSVLSNSVRPHTGKELTANVFWIAPFEGRVGDSFNFKCVTQEVACVVKGISHRYDPGLEQELGGDADSISESEVANMALTLEADASFDTFSDFPATGRFVLEKDGYIAAAGAVI